MNIEASPSESNRIKILYICAEADIAGGGQRSFLALLKHLDKKVFSPVVVLPRPGLMQRLIEEMGVPTEFLNLPSFKPWRFVSVSKTIHKLRTILANHNIGLLHVDSPRAFLYASLAKQDQHLIFHARVTECNGFLDKLADMYLYNRKCDRIIAVSKAVSKRFGKNETNKIVVIPNGIDEEFIDAPKKSKNLNTNTVGFAGQIWSKKGFIDFLEMARLVLTQLPQTYFLIAGKGNATEESFLLDKIKTLNISKNVQWLGFREDMVSFYDLLDVFVYPSRFGEGIPRAVMEAMSRGCTVVATDIGGTKELVLLGVNGVLVPPGDIDSLVQVVIRLLSSPEERLRLGQAACNLIKSDFTAFLMTSRIEAVYKEVIANTHA